MKNVKNLKTIVSIVTFISTASMAQPIAEQKLARYTCPALCVVTKLSTNGSWSVKTLGTVRGKSNYSLEEAWDLLEMKCKSWQESIEINGQWYILSNLNRISISTSKQNYSEIQYNERRGFFRRELKDKSDYSSNSSFNLSVPSASEKDCKINTKIPESSIPKSMLNQYGG